MLPDGIPMPPESVVDSMSGFVREDSMSGFVREASGAKLTVFRACELPSAATAAA